MKRQKSAYRNPEHLYMLVWAFIRDAKEPVDRLTIARGLGYHSASAIHKTLRLLNETRRIVEISFQRPNGTVKYYYTISLENHDEDI